MKKALMMLCGLLSLQLAFGQNLITNGDFETVTTPFTVGTVANAAGWVNGCSTWSPNPGSPDLISYYATQTFLQIPLDGRIGARNNGFQNRTFVGMMGGPADPNFPPGYRESIIGTINEPLSADYEYTVGLWVAAWSMPNSTAPVFHVEIILRKPGNCTAEKLVYSSGNVPVLNHGNVGSPTSNWSNITGTFTLTGADIAEGYTRMEIRLNGDMTMMRTGIDDVSLTKRLLPKAAFSFVTPGQTYTMVDTPWGPTQVTQVCAAPAPTETTILINGSASANESGYYISVTPWDPEDWVSTGAAMFNNWVTPLQPVPATNINISTLSGVTIQSGQTYLVTLAVGNPWHSVHQLFRVNPLPTLNAGADQTICIGNSVSINATADTWPVKVYNGATLVGTFNSNPISLSPTSTTTYTFTSTSQYNCYTSDQLTVTVNNCPTPSFVFKHPIGSEVVTTPYGPQTVTHICSPYKIDGSASMNEVDYHFRIQKFDPGSWSFLGSPLYDNWYGTGQVGNDIDLYTVVQSVGNSFTYGEIYAVGLTVGPGWYSTMKLFRAIDCRKNGEVAFEDVSVENEVMVFPNPTSGAFTVMLDGVAAEQVMVTNVLGETVFSSAVAEEVQSMDIDLSGLPSGVYMVHVKQANGETILKKIVKS